MKKYILLALVLAISLSGCMTQPKYSVDGHVEEKYSKDWVKEVTVKFSDEGTATTDNNGYFQKIVEGETKVTAAKEKYVFEPKSKTIQSDAIVNFDAIPYTRVEVEFVEKTTSNQEITATYTAINEGLKGKVKLVALQNDTKLTKKTLLISEGETKNLDFTFSDSATKVEVYSKYKSESEYRKTDEYNF